MSSERDNRAVVRMWLVVVGRVGFKAVIEAARKVVHVQSVEFGRRHHLPEIPEFHRLVFSVGDDVSPIAFAVDVGQSFRMAHEDASFTAVTH